MPAAPRIVFAVLTGAPAALPGCARIAWVDAGVPKLPAAPHIPHVVAAAVTIPAHFQDRIKTWAQEPTRRALVAAAMPSRIEAIR